MGEDVTITEALGNHPQVVDAAALAVRHVASTNSLYGPLEHVMIRDRWAFAADGYAVARIAHMPDRRADWEGWR